MLTVSLRPIISHSFPQCQVVDHVDKLFREGFRIVAKHCMGY